MDSNLLILGGGILVVIVLVVIIAIIRNNRPKRRTRRRYQRDKSGELISIDGTRFGDDSVTLTGTGSYSGNSAQLQTGYYVISYELDTPTRVAIIAEKDGDEETLLMSSGVGVQEFTIEESGQYLWRVETNIQNSKWRLVYRSVQRRGR